MNKPTARHLDADDRHTPEPSGLDELIGYALRRAQMQVFQRLVESLAPYDLRPAQFSALAIIAQSDGPTQAELAKALNIEPPQVVPLLNKLEEAGLALRIRNKTDKRSYGLYLSKPGERMLEILYAIAAQSDRAATDKLDDDERQQLIMLLRKVYREG
jgi:DNA-binding MarR family transcriptional regulator